MTPPLPVILRLAVPILGVGLFLVLALTDPGGGVGWAVGAGLLAWIAGRRLRAWRTKDLPRVGGIRRLPSDGAVPTALSGDPGLVFKHSLTCPTSAAALARVREFALERPEVLIYQVDVQTELGVSREVTRVTGVPHASPQLLGIRDGKVTGALSHGAIRRPAIDHLWAETARGGSDPQRSPKSERIRGSRKSEPGAR